MDLRKSAGDPARGGVQPNGEVAVLADPDGDAARDGGESDLAAPGVVQVAGDGPETVWTCTRSAALLARITSPETVSRVRSPPTLSASTGPDVIFAAVLPRRPIRVIWPAVTSTLVCWRSPEATNEPATRLRSANTSAGTATETSTREWWVIARNHRRASAQPRPLLADEEPAVLVGDEDGPPADPGDVDAGRAVGGDHVEPPAHQADVQPGDRAVHGEPLRAVDRPSGHGVLLATTRPRASDEQTLTRYIATAQD
ncbi:hypothetical protein GCM10027614_61580 [Micromonospora vulcania]